MTGILVGTCLLAGYLLGRARPWTRLADWAHDQVRFGGSWMAGSRAKQAVLLAAWAATSPVSTWRAFTSRKQDKP